MSDVETADTVATFLSAGRLERYLDATERDPKEALALYEWNVTLSGACFEALHYVEVTVRNAIDEQLRLHFDEAGRGIPWFLLPVLSRNQAQLDERVQIVRDRLRKQGSGRETRGQIFAGLEFGIWPFLLHSEHEQLWRDALRKAFPNSSGNRKDVVSALEQLRLFRNRLAHHDSLLAVDIRLRLTQMRDVMRWVDDSAETWFDRVERVSSVYRQRPGLERGVVVVAAKEAWPLYLQVGAYLCQSGRAFRPVDHIAFYADREIKIEVPRIVRRIDNVRWSEADGKKLIASAREEDRQLGRVVLLSLEVGWAVGRYQAFVLTRPGEKGHVTLPKSIRHEARGRGSAFTQGQRYVGLAGLRAAQTTDDL